MPDIPQGTRYYYYSEMSVNVTMSIINCVVGVCSIRVVEGYAIVQ